MGDRCHLLGEPEMPVVHAGAVAGLLLRARGRAGEEAQGQDPQLVHGHEPAARLLERDHAHLSPHRADEMNAVLCPEAVHEAKVRSTLLNEFGLEIGAGLGPLKGKIWRFGLMGYSCRPDNVMLCLSALGSVLNDMALPVHVGDAEAAAHQAYATLHAADARHARKKVASVA